MKTLEVGFQTCLVWTVVDRKNDPSQRQVHTESFRKQEQV
jgi:hypothetical protein